MPDSIKDFVDDYAVSPADFQWGRCFIIMGPGGARTDFLYSWLSNLSISLPLKFNWQIDVATGKTNTPLSAQAVDRAFFKNKDLTFISWLKSKKNSSSIIIAQKTHYLTFNLNNLLPHFSIVVIVLDKEDIVQATWEFFLKTFFKKNQFNVENIKFLFPDLDNKLLAEMDIISLFDQGIRKTLKALIVSNNTQKYTIQQDLINVSYKDITHPAGSYKLAQVLNIEPNYDDHELWARAIRFAASPPRISAFGKIWTKEEFNRIYNEVLSTINE